MGNNWIINVAHPRDPKENSEHEHHVVTAKTMYDYIKLADGKFLKANEDSVLDGRLNMQQHKIINLADPVNSYDAVNLRYVSSRIQALTDENRKLSDKIATNQRVIAFNWHSSEEIGLRTRVETLERLAGILEDRMSLT